MPPLPRRISPGPRFDGSPPWQVRSGGHDTELCGAATAETSLLHSSFVRSAECSLCEVDRSVDHSGQIMTHVILFPAVAGARGGSRPAHLPRARACDPIGPAQSGPRPHSGRPRCQLRAVWAGGLHIASLSTDHSVARSGRLVSFERSGQVGYTTLILREGLGRCTTPPLYLERSGQVGYTTLILREVWAGALHHPYT